MKHPKFTHSFEVESDLPEVLRPLKELAFNLHWTWSHATQSLFREIDKALWREVGHNPVELLNKLPREKLAKLAKDPGFLADLKVCSDELNGYLNAETWFDRTYPGQRQDTVIAYFCAEFGLSESLPIYSGGLGVLAGDHLKAASDLGLPLVGVGLLYSRGYFRQVLTFEGWQQEDYPLSDFFHMPLELIRDANQQPVRIKVENEHLDRPIVCQIWKAHVGRVPLYLLDSNVLENQPDDQGITDTLYGGDDEMRVRQEAILGAGGLRALEILGIKPTVCHMNEGHSAFLTLERISSIMRETGCDYRVARKAGAAGNVFTTHTPVPAGFDAFKPELLKRHVSNLVATCSIPYDYFLSMGKKEKEVQEGADFKFNMAVLAMENSNRVNAVSKLHSGVARNMFHNRWEDYPEDEVPIDAITNGIHTMTWLSPRMAELFDTYLGSAWREDPSNSEHWKGVWDIPDQELWEVRNNLRGDFVRYVRRRVLRDIGKRGAVRPDAGDVDGILDPRVLTIGFARRFATYKRATLLLKDRDRLKSLIHQTERPIQFVFAGKSHPRDDEGKKFIQELVQFIKSENMLTKMVFLEDYDMGVGRAMTHGVDVWLNNPRRPYEASGTSGMKVVPNGGLNCSVLDGWWDEAYHTGVGWAIGDRRDYTDPEYQDWADSKALYHVLEHEVARRFYSRIDSEPPAAWCELVKRSIAELSPVFSTQRMVREYAERYYMPASQAYREISSDGLARAKAAVPWREKIQKAWPSVKILEVHDTAGAANPIGAVLKITAKVDLGTLSESDVQVQAVIGNVGPSRELWNVSHVTLDFVGKDGGASCYEGTIEVSSSGHKGYSIRVVPCHEDVSIPIELNLVTWEGS